MGGDLTVSQEQRGRPRDEALHQAILDTALAQVLELGFRAVSVESIAAGLGIAKTTIYRRWPNKAAVIMDAFTAKVGVGSLFPAQDSALESIRLQIHAMARSFRGSDGALVKSLLAEAQFDPELAVAFRERWTLPRRRMAIEVIREAIQEGDLRSDADPEEVIDLLYAPIYYQLQTGLCLLTEEYVEGIFRRGIEGLGRHEQSRV